MRTYSFEEVNGFFGRDSVQMLHRNIQRGYIPRPIQKAGPTELWRWPADEIDQLIAARAVGLTEPEIQQLVAQMALVRSAAAKGKPL